MLGISDPQIEARFQIQPIDFLLMVDGRLSQSISRPGLIPAGGGQFARVSRRIKHVHNKHVHGNRLPSFVARERDGGNLFLVVVDFKFCCSGWLFGLLEVN